MGGRKTHKNSPESSQWLLFIDHCPELGHMATIDQSLEGF